MPDEPTPDTPTSELPTTDTDTPASEELPTTDTDADAPATEELPTTDTDALATTELPVTDTDALATTELPVTDADAPATAERPVTDADGPPTEELPTTDTDAPATAEVPLTDADARTGHDPAVTEHRFPLSWARVKSLAIFAIPIYLLSRMAVIAGAAVVASELRIDANLAAEDGLPNQDPHGVGIGVGSAIRPMVNVLTSWDGKWYMDLVRGGYPTDIPPNVTYFDVEAKAAFFPVFPMLGRLFDTILPGGDTFAVLLMNTLFGFVAVVLIGMIAENLYGEAVGRRSIMLAALFPGSFVFSFAYSEAVMLMLAAGCLLALLNDRWLLAGILAAGTTAARPNGVAVVVAAAVAAYLAIWVRERAAGERRDWSPLIAVLLAPVGFITFQVWLGMHTGETFAWFRVQREAWDEGASLGWTALKNTGDAIIHPLTSPTDTITALCVVATALLVYFSWRVRLHLILTAYSAVVLALMLAPATVTARPRFIFTAFPVLIAAALWFEQRRDHPNSENWWTLNAVACGAGLAAVTGLYGVFGAIP